MRHSFRSLHLHRFLLPIVMALGFGGGWAVPSGFAAPQGDGAPSGSADSITAFVGAKVFPAPDAAPLENAVVVVTGTKITAVGSAAEVQIPEHARRIDAHGLSLLAGFWNCHVHFTEPKWLDAAHRPADELTQNLRTMLTQYGFTTVVDLASDLANTSALRKRIEAGEVSGPRVLTAGFPLFPENGVPFYVVESLPEMVPLLPTPATPEEAVQVVQRDIARGADLIKLFLVTGVRRPDHSIGLKGMSPAVARAAVKEAHQHGRLVFAHPSTIDGVNLALNGGVDVLAHSVEDPDQWTPDVVKRLRAANVAFVPTLALFSGLPHFPAIQQEVKRYAEAGGEVLFGTDVGYLSDYAQVAREFQLMRDAGLSFPELLATLTTAPVKRFSQPANAGRVVVGGDADLVLLAGDPSRDTGAFLRVRYTVRSGRMIYSRD